MTNELLIDPCGAIKGKAVEVGLNLSIRLLTAHTINDKRLTQDCLLDYLLQRDK